MGLPKLDEQIHVMEPNITAMDALTEIIDSGLQEAAFYIMDVGKIVKQFNEWRKKLPRVDPFYAVKCNDNAIILKVLAALGAGFDCASKIEINKVLDLGVHPSRIIYANPVKVPSQIRYASTARVNLMTFDNESELHKIKEHFPSARLVLRFRCDSIVIGTQHGVKFGCNATTEAPYLFEVAKSLGLTVCGISFHVGSLCDEPSVFDRAITIARSLFDAATELGFHMTLLDLGGGYIGHRGYTIDKIADVINNSLEVHFPATDDIDIIAEPGHFIAASSLTLATYIVGKRECTNHTMYYINDGVYGSFHSVLSARLIFKITPYPFQRKIMPDILQPSSIWGPTCDGVDRVRDNFLLPKMETGDWLIFEEMGAYSLNLATTFNGIEIPKVHPVISKPLWLSLKDQYPFKEDHFLTTNVPYWLEP